MTNGVGGASGAAALDACLAEGEVGFAVVVSAITRHDDRLVGGDPVGGTEDGRSTAPHPVVRASTSAHRRGRPPSRRGSRPT